MAELAGEGWEVGVRVPSSTVLFVLNTFFESSQERLLNLKCVEKSTIKFSNQIKLPEKQLSYPVALKKDNLIIDIDIHSPKTIRAGLIAKPPTPAEGEEAVEAPKISVITNLAWASRSDEARKELMEKLVGGDPQLVKDAVSQRMGQQVAGEQHAFKT